jgi:hypothetical protein
MQKRVPKLKGTERKEASGRQGVGKGWGEMEGEIKDTSQVQITKSMVGHGEQFKFHCHQHYYICIHL